MSHVFHAFVTAWYHSAFARKSPAQKAQAIGSQLKVNARELLISLFEVLGIDPVSKNLASVCSKLWKDLTYEWCDINHIVVSVDASFFSGAILIAHLFDHPSRRLVTSRYCLID